jgi:cytidylate kinase
VVCISRAVGAGGEEVGRRVAARLGFLYVDEEIVSSAAAKGGIGPAEVADAERRKSLVSRWLEAMAHGGVDGWAMSVSTPELAVGLSGDDIRALIRETVAQTVAQGKVVIVAHAASHAVTPGPEHLRVLVTASPTTRAARIGEAQALDGPRSAREVKDSDAARRDYLKRFYGITEEAPTHYDLVVNTDVLSTEQAAALIAFVVSGAETSPPRPPPPETERKSK